MTDSFNIDSFGSFVFRMCVLLFKKETSFLTSIQVRQVLAKSFLRAYVRAREQYYAFNQIHVNIRITILIPFQILAVLSHSPYL